MNIVPYSISESTKISEAYIGTVNEASAKWGATAVSDINKIPIAPIADTPKTAQDYIAPSVEQITRNNIQAQHGMNEIDDISAPTVSHKPKQTYISAASPSSNRKQLFTLDDIRKRGGMSAEDVLLSVIPVGRVAKFAKVAGFLGNFFKGTGKAITGTGKFIKKHPIITSPLTTSAGVYLDQKLNDGKVTDAAATLYNDVKNGVKTAWNYCTDTAPTEDKENYIKVSQQNADITRENNDQLDRDAIAEMDAVFDGDATESETNAVVRLLGKMGITNADDSKLKSTRNLPGVLRNTQK